ncbi:hypothetical protein [Kaistia adipata]|uniref:hypothetical protein n=1 Tax=Kaistia adipata TaxID=166954 RepID=UPI0004919D0B|nr:hypothetical protein [Kaistia adipata]
MNSKFALATATAMTFAALTAGVPASAASTHGLSCKAGTQATRVMEKGKHVWRCEPTAHHATPKPHETMAPQGSSSGGTSY